MFLTIDRYKNKAQKLCERRWVKKAIQIYIYGKSAETNPLVKNKSWKFLFYRTKTILCNKLHTHKLIYLNETK